MLDGVADTLSGSGAAASSVGDVVVERVKRFARRLVDSSSGSSGGRRHDADGSRPDLVLTDFNHLLHELRTIELRHLPVDGGVLLSAGCAGTWYFEWLDACAGPFRRHIGVELYETEPDDLPAEVTWIAESASRMPTVPDATVDVVFSGQNIEHLWIDDLNGFLLEARRVLRPGGLLVVDSPNRFAVEALDVGASRALDRDDRGRGGAPVRDRRVPCRGRARAVELPRSADPRLAHPPTRRSRSSRDPRSRRHPRRDVDDDFVWWIEASRGDVDVDPGAVRAEVVRLFDLHWNTRVNRGAVCAVPRSAAGTCDLPIGACGVVYRTLAFPLFPGRYRVTASHPSMHVLVRRSDGSVLAEGSDAVEGSIDRTHFGITVELGVDPPLTEPMTDVRVGVEVVGVEVPTRTVGSNAELPASVPADGEMVERVVQHVGDGAVADAAMLDPRGIGEHGRGRTVRSGEQPCDLVDVRIVRDRLGGDDGSVASDRHDVARSRGAPAVPVIDRGACSAADPSGSAVCSCSRRRCDPDPPRQRSIRSGSIATSSDRANSAATACLHASSPDPESSGQVQRIHTLALARYARARVGLDRHDVRLCAAALDLGGDRPCPTTMSITALSAQ